MTEIEFFSVVAKMRQAQKKFFAARSNDPAKSEWLKESKRLEKNRCFTIERSIQTFFKRLRSTKKIVLMSINSAKDANGARRLVECINFTDDDTIKLYKEKKLYFLEIQKKEETFFVNVIRRNNLLIQFKDKNLQAALYLAIDFVYV